ncbi:DegT/DnrJ/EryC1/StrS family aminotransferase [Patescibacteria group bacterium]
MIIPFEKKYQKKYYKLLDQVFESNFLSHGKMNIIFENKFSNFTNLHCSTISNGGAGLLALLKYINVEGEDVIVPTNTFIATPMAVKMAGGNIVFADCKKDDLCIGLDQIKEVITTKTKAVIVVHIGGHIAFDIFEISKFCRSKGIALIEDCAHAHGALYKGSSAGSFGMGGSYSFYATKTIPMGEGGMVVSSNKKVIDFVNKFKNYGKLEYQPGKFKYPLEGFNFRMSEIMAAFGIIQMERIDKILNWKRRLASKYDKIFNQEQRIVFQKEMQSGYYKYIVFNTKLKQKTGSVFDDLCHNLMGVKGSYKNSEYIAKEHSCPPMYFGWEFANKSVKELKKIILK